MLPARGLLLRGLALVRARRRGLDLVVLDCDSCNRHKGMQIVWRTDGSYNGRYEHYTLPLTEGAGWLQKPAGPGEAWRAPSRCALIEALSAVSRWKILGDLTRGHESVGLDNVVLRHGDEPTMRLPVAHTCFNLLLLPRRPVVRFVLTCSQWGF